MHTVNQLMNAAHRYARDYTAGSFTLGDRSIDKEEFILRTERVRRSWERLTVMVADTIDESGIASTRDAIIIGWEIMAYAESRREGQGTDAADSLRELFETICA